jgi:hypothetical protein
MSTETRRVQPTLWILLLALAAAPPARAQATAADDRPAFTLSSGAIGSSRQPPAVFLTFRRVTRLDVRVYRVNDPLTFVAGLKDPHQLGSAEPLVDQVPTLLERIANWKAERREDLRDFVRAQFSWRYRVSKRQSQDKQAVQLRRTEKVNTFAQVPLLNASQLVTSWREILPAVRDTEFRRIPLDLQEPGMYVVEAIAAPLKAYTVVIVSDIGMVSKAAPGQVLLYTANRFTGQPVPNCDLRVVANRAVLASGTTGADGTFTADLASATAEDIVAVARCGRDVAATDPGGWYLREKARDLVGYVYTDKPIYRPGHTTHLKAVLRWRSHGALVPFDRPQIEVRITDPTDKVVLRQPATVDAFGAVHASWPVSTGAALGYYQVSIVSDDDEASGSFEVQEYRKPEFEVRVGPVTRFVNQGDDVRATVDARYYFGQPVARGKVHYVVHRQPYYSPLRWSDDESGEGGGWWYAGEQTIEGDVRLDEKGLAEIVVPSEPDEEGRDYSLRLEARVTDAGGREVSGDTLVHATYGPFLIVATQDQYVKKPGSVVTLNIRGIDYAGNPQKGKVVQTLLEFGGRYGNWREAKNIAVVARGTVTTDEQGRATWSTTVPAEPGDYRLRATVTAGDREVGDSAYVWVPGAAQVAEYDSGERYLELIADQRSYKPGDTARILVRGEEFDAPVLVTKENQHVSWHQVVRVQSNTAFEVPIGEEDIGDTWVNVAFLRDDRLYRAEKRMGVPATSRQLQVAITADQPVSRPGKPARFQVTATDPAGQPVRAQLSLAVIDEAVYGVKQDDTPDPLRYFYRREYSRVGTSFSREYSFIGYSGTQELTLARMRKRPHGLADFKGDRARPQVRKEFPDAIYWVADLVTDDQGHAAVEVTYPDALTTWRLTARAITADTRVGGAVARTTTTKDLIVRMVTPRFLSQGDQVIVPVVTHNFLPGEKRIQVDLAAEGLTAQVGPGGPAASSPQQVTVASGGEARLDWRFTADSVGTATLTARATTDVDGDALELVVPVLPFGLKSEVSETGSMLGAGERAVALAVPSYANPSGRTIRVAMAPSLAGSMLGALDFLTNYPYGCTEQILSSFVPNLLVSRALQQIGLAPTERLRVLDRQVTVGIGKLLDNQHEDGGWGWWKADENHPFMTAYAVFGLLEAKKAGYKVDEWKIRNGARALATLYARYPRAVPALKAYEVWVLARVGAALEPGAEAADGYDPAAAIDSLWNARGDLMPYGQALLLQALDVKKDPRAATLAHELLGAVKRSGDLAYWESGSDPLLDDWMDTNVESTALAVQALVAHEPDAPALEAAVKYLIANRTGSYWTSTKATAMVLYGLLDYMKARRETAEPFTADVFVNGQTAGTASFTAASLTNPEPVVIAAPARDGANDVRIVKKGGGVLYWSATATFYDSRSPVERTGSRALAMVRRYFALAPVTKGSRTVYRETPFGGTAKPGDVVLVRLSVAGSPDWRYLMIEDPLPAGAEPIADDDLYELETRGGANWWVGRREYRDDRAAFFRDRLRDGRVDLYYLLKITTPGTFKAMPARVVPMYASGVSASSQVQPVSVPAAAEGAPQ